jgi:hypothetical protein
MKTDPLSGRCRMRPSRWELLVCVALLAISFSEAFLAKEQTGWRHPRQQQQSRILQALQLAKSGGKLIETEDMYVNKVLAKDSPRPVLVFFSAPW